MPLAGIPSRLPDYSALDSTSMWHTTAILATAVESVTLPSRIRRGEAGFASLGDLEEILNLNGRQQIARLQFSIPERSRTGSRGMASSYGEHRERMADRIVNPDSVRDSPGRDGYGGRHPCNVDIDLLPELAPVAIAGSRRPASGVTTFGRVWTFRGRDFIREVTPEDGHRGMSNSERFVNPPRYRVASQG
jgi:hypothetical protein